MEPLYDYFFLTFFLLLIGQINIPTIVIPAEAGSQNKNGDRRTANMVWPAFVIAVLFGYSTFLPLAVQAQNWQNLGLNGGQIYEIAIDPDDNDKMFAGAYYGDGLYVSQNKGGSWMPVLTGHEGGELDGEATFRNTAVWSVKIVDPLADSDPSNNLVWAAHNYWVAKSTDGGENWTHIDNEAMQDNCTNCPNDSVENPYQPGSEQFRYCRTLAVSPSDPDIVYVGTSGPNGSPLKGAIYKTIDGGESWTKMGMEGLFDAGGYAVTLDHEFYSTIVAIAFHPENSNIVWALDFNDELGDYRGFLYVSTDGGNTWNWDLGWPAHIGENGLAVKPDEPNIVFLGTFSGIVRVEYQTDEYGNILWNQSVTYNLPLGGSAHNVRALVFDPQDPSILYASKGNAGGFQLLKSLDGGETFLTYPHDQQFISLTPDPTDSGIIFGGDRTMGVYKGQLLGAHPDPRDIIIVDNGDEGTSFSGTWNTITWGCGYNGDWSIHNPWSPSGTYTFESSVTGEYNVSMWWVANSERDPNQPIDIYDGETKLAAVTVDQMKNGCQWNSLGNYTFNGTAKVVVTSTNNFKNCADAIKFDNDLTSYSWTPVSDGLRAIRVNDIAVDPNKSDHLIAATMAGVYERLDGSAPWQSSANLRYNEAFSVEFDPFDTDGSTYYAGVESFLAKTTDNGANWTYSNSLGYPHFVNDIAVDPNNSSNIFITTRYPGNVYKSTDGGATLTGEMKFAAILDSGPSHAATFTLNADGSFAYTHNNDDATADTFAYHNNDGISDSSSTTVTITITPSAANILAVDDTFAVEIGGSLIKTVPPGLLSNDIGNNIEAVQDSDVSHGTLSMYKDGSFTYIHDGSGDTTDSFTYHVTDGEAGSNTATVTFTILSDHSPPMAVADTYTVEKGGSLDISYSYYWYPQGVLHNDIKSNDFDFNAVVIDPSDSNHILVGGGRYYGADIPGKLLESKAGGTSGSWNTVLDNVTVNALLFDPDNSDLVYAGCGDSEGTDKPIYRSTDGGTNWTRSYEGIPGEPTRTDVWGSSADDVFVLSHNGSLDHDRSDDRKIFHFNGSVWSEMDAGVSTKLNTIHGLSGSSVFAVGEGGTILHYNGSVWSRQTSGTTKDLAGVWASGTTVWAVGQEGTLLRSLNSGSNWSSITDLTRTDLSDVWGSSPSDIYVVGAYGIILHSNDGNSWSQVESGTTSRLLDIWGSSASDMFAVGRNGTILHFDGSNWSSMNSGTAKDLYAVWGSSSSNVYAVGDGGTLLRFDGSSWSTQASGTANRLYSVWGSSAGNVYAVGLYGAILQNTGSGWIPVPTSVAGDLTRNWNAVTDIKYLSDSTSTSKVIYAATNRQGIYLSPNQGESWVLMGPPLNYEVLALATGSCFVASPNGAWQAGIGTVLGWVTESGSVPKRPIPDAKVSIADVGLYDQTDANGIYMISGVTAGPSQYQLNVQADGYGSDATLPNEVWVYGGSSTRVDFELEDPVVAIVTDVAGVSVPEGSTNIFGVKLNAQPSSDIAVTVSKLSGDSDITVSGNSLLVFTPSDWDIFQPVTLSAAEDDSDTTNGSAAVRCASTMAVEANLTATEIDDDFLLTVTDDGNGSTTPGGSSVFDPSDAALAISATPDAGYTFGSWSVTLGSAAIDDPSSAATTVIPSSDATVQANFTANVVAIVTGSSTVSVPEGGTNSFQVKLSAQPAANVTVSVSRTSGDSDISVTTGSSLTFTTANWSTFQTVTLSAAEDNDTANGSAVITCASASAANKDVTATEVDDDFTLTVTTDGNGTTVPSGSTVVDPADPPLAISATAKAGYSFSSWSVTSGSATIANTSAASTTVTASSNATVQANFIVDLCPGDPNKTEPGACGCGVADTDTDGDGVLDCNDLWPGDPHEWSDNDGDGIGDNADLDDDDDGMPDLWEEFYGLDPLLDDALEDFDGDRYTNLSEYRMGTDPTDPEDPGPRALPWLPLLLQ